MIIGVVESSTVLQKQKTSPSYIIVGYVVKDIITH